MRRWKIRTRTISGTVTITEAAMMLPQGSSWALAPEISAIATGTVRISVDRVKVSANRNSFQAAMKAKQAGGRQGRAHQRQEDLGDDGEGLGTVDDRRLLDLLGQVAHEGGEHPDRERQGEDHVAERERQQVVVDAEPGDQLEHAREHGDLREHRDAEDGEQQERAAAELDPAQRVGGGDGEAERQDHGRDATNSEFRMLRPKGCSRNTAT